MFTGIIEAVARVIELTSMEATQRLRLETALASELVLGDSLAVNGVCLTVTARQEGAVQFDIGPETARVTNLGALRQGQRVNVERAMRLQDRLGGHLVLGHVDGIGVVEQIRGEGDSYWLAISYPTALAPYFIRKGSVAVDGVSLTVAGLGQRHFDVQIIPHTWQHTTLSALQVNDNVNLECDMIGKYVLRSLELLDTIRQTS
jgi:riboflavin synthase